MEQKKLSAQVIEVMGNIAFAATKKVFRGLLYVDRHFWKAYFNLETPLYKMWWKAYAENMQKKLDKIHNKGMVFAA